MNAAQCPSGPKRPHTAPKRSPRAPKRVAAPAPSSSSCAQKVALYRWLSEWTQITHSRVKNRTRLIRMGLAKPSRAKRSGAEATLALLLAVALPRVLWVAPAHSRDTRGRGEPPS